MNKKDYKDYQKPTMNVVKIQHQAHLLAGSGEITDENDNLGGDGFVIGGGGSGGGR